MTSTKATTAFRRDEITKAATDLALEAAQEEAGDFGVGEHLGCIAEGNRVITHQFACTHPGYPGWYWAVTLVRAARAKQPTVSEVVLLPGEGALTAAEWVPWKERLEPDDLAPGTLLPTPDNDPRLEPGFVVTEMASGLEPAEASQIRAVVHELGLGRERVLSREGRDQAAKRWSSGEGGKYNQMSRQAPADCQTCGYFIRLRGGLGNVFGVCANEWTPFDGRVVTVEHGCGAHSDVVEEKRAVEPEMPVFDTITPDEANLFD